MTDIKKQQIKMIQGGKLSLFQSEINTFLKSKDHENIKDIKYSMIMIADEILYSAMIIYLSEGNDEE